MPLHNIAKKEERHSFVFSKSRVIGIVLLLVTVIEMISVYTPYMPKLNNVVLGVFGILGYILPMIMLFFEYFLLTEKKITNCPIMIVYGVLSLYFLFCIFSCAYSKVNLEVGYLQYIKVIYNTRYMPIGVLSGLTAYPIAKLLGIVPMYLLYGILFVLNIGLLLELSIKKHFKIITNGFDISEYKENANNKYIEGNTISLNEIIAKSNIVERMNENLTKKEEPTIPTTAIMRDFNANRTSKTTINKDLKHQLAKANKGRYMSFTACDSSPSENMYNNFKMKSILTESEEEDENSIIEEKVSTQKEVLSGLAEVEKAKNERANIDVDKILERANFSELLNGSVEDKNKEKFDTKQEAKEREKSNYEKFYENKYNNQNNDNNDSNSKLSEEEYFDEDYYSNTDYEDEEENDKYNEDISKNGEDIDNQDDYENFDFKDDTPRAKYVEDKEDDETLNNDFKVNQSIQENVKSSMQIEEKPKPKPKPKVKRPYTPPPLSLLADSVPRYSESYDYYQENKDRIEKILRSFNVNAEVVRYNVGTRITRYEIAVEDGIKLSSLRTFIPDIKAAMESVEDIVMYTPLPGTQNIGIDVPNKNATIVSFKEMINTDEFKNSKDKDLFVIGKTLIGKNMYARLKDLPHMLVAGSTGSGKSVFLNSLLISLIYHSTPDDIRFILIDPKYVEFSDYKGIPHMLLESPVNESEQANKVLEYAVEEMNSRYKLFQECGCRKYEEYIVLPRVKSGELKAMPRILIIIDELGDLMCQDGRKNLESNIMQLAQKARAAGIYMILATQRPTTQVVTGNIKANLPSRVSFKLSSLVDSRVIMDEPGAEKLLGKGDMLIKMDSLRGTERLQGPYIDTEEIKKITNFVKENNDCVFDEEVEEKIYNDKKTGKSEYGNEPTNLDISLVAKVIKYCFSIDNISISKIQRAFKIGFLKAADIIDYLEDKGYLSELNYNKKRELLITKEEYNEIYGDKYGKVL